MGGASSKAARKLPRSPPSWAGARTPHPEVPGGPGAAVPNKPLASETRTDAINLDARDPQLLANLNRLGPVRVDHNMQTVRAKATHKLFNSRAQSELEASSHKLARNHLTAGTLSLLLDERKSVSSKEELDDLAKKWNLDGESKVQSLAKFVNSPSVHSGRRVVTGIGKDEEIVLTPVSCLGEIILCVITLNYLVLVGCMGRT
ncbi:hypothetical protein BDN72DRAFT_763214 [Pluteus cervinus]|uniref:Uncharacterized protein n=1 Tax=Pluteus cervinus TaxID=181527 RepID=A0ACD3B4F9_9AGAR|nr:hypothetical protein BDN72DRAFT_763214 [Pluteus cervinus]